MADTFAENIPSPVSPQALYPVVAGFLETVLNRLLYSENVLKPARARLTGKTLTLRLTEPDMQFTLIFSEKQLDVISRWEDPADCVLQTRFLTLLKLKDKQQLLALIRQGDVIIDGDMQVIQHFSALLDMAESESGTLSGTVYRRYCRTDTDSDCRKRRAVYPSGGMPSAGISDRRAHP